jgi:diguanylate cyclase (GGDEF)-like protein
MADKKALPPMSAILEKVFEDAPEYLVVLDPSLQIQMAGAAFRAAMNYEPKTPKSFLDTVERFAVSRVRDTLERLRKDGVKHETIEVRHLLPDATTVSVTYSFVACLDELGECRALVGLGREDSPSPQSREEIDALKNNLETTTVKMERRAKEIARLRQELQKQTTRDDMTELGNRRFLLERLEVEVARASRYDQPLTLILFDVDRMGNVNDTFGRDKGDEVIREVARVVREQIRNTDVAGRYDGEEFMVLCPHTDRANAQFLAERLRRRIAELSFQGEQEEFGVTISVGLVTLTGQNEFATEAILQAAENAVATAKQSGMNRVKILEIV